LYDNDNNDDEFCHRYILQNQKKVKKVKIMHIHSELPDEDIIKLKKKTGESSTKDAILTAIYYYLGNAKAN
jgi:hypothetical protein